MCRDNIYSAVVQIAVIRISALEDGDDDDKPDGDLLSVFSLSLHQFRLSHPHHTPLRYDCCSAEAAFLSDLINLSSFKVKSNDLNATRIHLPPRRRPNRGHPSEPLYRVKYVAGI